MLNSQPCFPSTFSKNKKIKASFGVLRLLIFFPLICLLMSCQTIPDPRRITRITEYHKTTDITVTELDILRDSGINPEHAGYALYDIQSGRTVAEWNSGKTFIPGCNAKIITSIAVLEILGINYQFETRLWIDGYIEDGILHGDVILEGTGDPFLLTPDIMAIAFALQTAGVQKVSGNFYYDDSALPSTEKLGVLPHDYDSFNTGISALSADFNLFSLEWLPGDSMGEARYYKIPNVPHVGVHLSDHEVYPNKKMTYVSPEQWGLSNRRSFRGQQNLPVKDSSLYTAMIFYQFARMSGVELPPPQAGKVTDQSELIFNHKGMPLHQITQIMMEYSSNVMGELMLLAAAKKLNPDIASIQDAVDTMFDWYRTQYPDLDWDSVRMTNGSGLDTSARVTPDFMVSLLDKVKNITFSGKPLMIFLPSSGLKGTLKNRLKEPETATRVWAKTGTMNYVVALAGYLHTQSNKRYIFGVYVTDYEKRRLLDSKEVTLEQKKVYRKAPSWIYTARTFQDNLVRYWARKY